MLTELDKLIQDFEKHDYYDRKEDVLKFLKKLKALQRELYIVNGKVNDLTVELEECQMELDMCEDA